MKKTSVSGLFILASLLLTFIPVANATVPVLDSFCVSTHPGTPSTCTINGPTSGDTIIMVGDECCSGSIPVVGGSDNHGVVYTTQIQTAVNTRAEFSPGDVVFITTGKQVSSASTTYTCTSNVGAFQSCEVYLVSGLLSGTALATATGGGHGTSMSASTTVDFNPSQTFLVAGLAAGGGTLTAGSGYTIEQPANDLSTGSEYAIPNPSPPAEPTSFAATINAAHDWNEAGAAFGPAVPTVTNVVACSFFELQCWWYPMLFFGVGLAPFMLIGGLGKVNSRGLTYLLLCGLVFTSMVEVLMGMINIMFPLIFTILTILYAVRIK